MANRRNRGQNEDKEMARIIVSKKKENGHYSFRQRMVALDDVQDEIKSAK